MWGEIQTKQIAFFTLFFFFLCKAETMSVLQHNYDIFTFADFTPPDEYFQNTMSSSWTEIGEVISYISPQCRQRDHKLKDSNELYFSCVCNDHKQIASELTTCSKRWICNTWAESRQYDPKKKNDFISQPWSASQSYKSRMKTGSSCWLRGYTIKLVAVGRNMCFWSTLGQGRLLQ